MPKAFLSHKSQDKQEVIHIQNNLHNYLIETWLDKDQLHAGSDLFDTFFEAVENNGHFVAFISEQYMDSEWCMRELTAAMARPKIKIIPVIVGAVDKVQAKASPKVKNLLMTTKYLVLNPYHLSKTTQQIAEAIWKDYPISCAAVEKKQIRDFEFLQISIRANSKNIPENSFENWNFSIRDFLDQAPFNSKLPIALEGRIPAWLYCYLAIPLFNNRDVYLYNNVSDGYVCVYSTKGEDTGRFIRRV
ncbi:MAG: toll/interleukin-1 receptor domain-containing protein [Bacteroidota bacterium]